MSLLEPAGDCHLPKVGSVHVCSRSFSEHGPAGGRTRRLTAERGLPHTPRVRGPVPCLRVPHRARHSGFGRSSWTRPDGLRRNWKRWPMAPVHARSRGTRAPALGGGIHLGGPGPPPRPRTGLGAALASIQVVRGQGGQAVLPCGRCPPTRPGLHWSHTAETDRRRSSVCRPAGGDAEQRPESRTALRSLFWRGTPSGPASQKADPLQAECRDTEAGTARCRAEGHMQNPSPEPRKLQIQVLSSGKSLPGTRALTVRGALGDPQGQDVSPGGC